jgi:hypothetical protein
LEPLRSVNPSLDSEALPFMKISAWLLPTGLLALLLAGCVTQTHVGRIVNDPYRFQNREIEIRGVVTGSVNAVVAGGYQVDDGTGKILVLSNGGAPRKGADVSVRGYVTPGVSVMGNSFGVTIRERDRRVNGFYRNSWRRP